MNLAIRSAWVAFVHPVPVSDFGFYFHSAQTLAAGGGYQMNGHPTAYWPAGWPLVLSLLFRIFGPHLWVGLAAQVLLTTGIALLVLLLAKQITGSVRVGLLAALAWTFLPGESLAWTALLGSEPLFTLLVLAMLYAAIRLSGWRRIVAVGALLGAACWVRPTVLLFPAVLAAIGIAYRRQLIRPLARAAAITLIMLAVIAPLTVRNYLVLGSPVLVSTNGGINLWQGMHADDRYWWPSDTTENPIRAVQGEVARNDAAEHAFVVYATHQPGTLAVHIPMKLVGLYGNSGNGWWWSSGGHWPKTTLDFARAVSTLAYLLFMAAALSGLVKAWRRWRWPTALLGGFLAYYTALFAFFWAMDRYRYPIMPVFAIFAGVALARAKSEPVAYADRPIDERP